MPQSRNSCEALRRSEPNAAQQIKLKRQRSRRILLVDVVEDPLLIVDAAEEFQIRSGSALPHHRQDFAFLRPDPQVAALEIAFGRRTSPLVASKTRWRARSSIGRLKSQRSQAKLLP